MSFNILATVIVRALATLQLRLRNFFYSGRNDGMGWCQNDCRRVVGVGEGVRANGMVFCSDECHSDMLDSRAY